MKIKYKFFVWSYVENKCIKKFAHEVDAKTFINSKIRTIGGAYIILDKNEVASFKKAGSQVLELT